MAAHLTTDTCAAAAAEGYVDAFQWLTPTGFGCDEDAPAVGDKWGHLQVMQ